MRSIARYGTIIVIIHALAVILHGLAHREIPVPLSPFQHWFVASIIVVAPIAAMILLWTPLQQLGSWLLLCSMAGALLFGVYHHFIVLSPDRISQVPLTDGGIVFHITAILLSLTEGIGCAIGAWGVSTLQRREQVL
jgi:hypothetical protein